MKLLYLANGLAVGVFGMVLSASFCEVVWTHEKRRALVGSMVCLLLLQVLVYAALEEGSLEELYPLVTHLPLAVVLCWLSGQRLWPVISVLTAYLCCQLRRWLALLVVAMAGGGIILQDVVQLAVTLPLLWALVRYAAPSVRAISHYPASVQWQFAVIPALSYGFDYLTRIYTDWLNEGSPVAVEFMPFVCCLAYLFFVLRTSEEVQARMALEQTQNSLNLQVDQAVREIEALRMSQKTASTYRHDLRHHLQYLSACIENGRSEQAQDYIHTICAEIDAGKVTVYCQNEAANLILSAFAGRAEARDVPLSIQAVIPQNLPVSESDLCVLLSNALENALHACAALRRTGQRAEIALSAYEKNARLFLEIRNSCGDAVAFDEEGIPVTDRPGHGIGVRSICAIVEKYGGVCSFSARNGWFVLRVSL